MLTGINQCCGPADISVDSISQPSFTKVRIKQSKTDKFWVGVDVIIGHTGGKSCLVEAVLAKGQDQGHCFSLRMADL